MVAPVGKGYGPDKRVPPKEFRRDVLVTSACQPWLFHANSLDPTSGALRKGFLRAAKIQSLNPP